MAHKTFDLNRIRDARVLVIGDIMLDNFIYGEVMRISPEAPIPVLASKAQKSMPGGAANVAIGVAAVGAGAILIGVAADDSEGATLRSLLSQGDFPVNCCIAYEPGRPTTVKTRYIAGSQQMLRVDREHTGPIAATTEQALLREVEKHVAEASVVALSDYGKGVLTDRVIAGTLSLARAAGKPTIVDPKRVTFESYRGATYIKPNIAELQRATGILCDTEERLAQAAGLVQAVTGADLLLTRSEEGMSLFQAGRTPQQVRSLVREIFDVSGAGDTALAAFAVGLASGYTAADAMLLANVAAGIAVSKLGTAVVTMHELAGTLNEGLFLEPADRVLSIDYAAVMCQAWRDRGLRIGFTNGCFDILHAGHVALLAKAAAECDRLVVGLNSDASIKSLKGPTRPAQDEASRAQVLASLDAVDLVVLFEEDTPIELISRLRPDVLVKGADYHEHEVVGSDLVKAYGGRVLLVDLVQGHSTTNTVKRVVNMNRT